MAFPDGFVDEVRRAADIVRVISDHVGLRKVGASWKGLCPFHGEKTPSFNVHGDRQFFHCFGCGAGGDVFKFIEQYDKIGFPDAVRQLPVDRVVAPSVHDAPRSGLDLVDLDDERLPGLRVAGLELAHDADAMRAHDEVNRAHA